MTPQKTFPAAVRLSRDRIFIGVLATQLLGAFNDNYFKQLVLLKCTALASAGETNLQPVAMAAFALPFVLISGFAGYLSDRFSKRTIIVLCKVGEIAVMAASLVALLAGRTPESQLMLLIVVLGFMGAQSAFFGPAKYGILPELFHPRQLLPVNGAVQMTTFLAIIFGTAAAGYALDRLGHSLWLCSLIAVGIAVLGTLTSLMIRPTEPAQPGLKFQPGNLFIPKDVRALLRTHRDILNALLVMSMFWFLGGVAQPAVNNLGELTFHLNNTRTSLLAASIGVGIAVGCVVAGFTGRGQSTGCQWTTRGSWLIMGSLVLITALGSGRFGQPDASRGVEESVLQSLSHANPVEWQLRGSMLLLGFSAGVFVIPLQVYIQQAPPAQQKGRLIGTMNFMTWIGLLLSAAFLWMMQTALLSIFGPEAHHQKQHLTFFALALLILPIAIWYRLPPLDEDQQQRADDIA